MQEHTVPIEWQEMERKLRADLEGVSPKWAQTSCCLALRGGWKVGYTWNKKFRLEITPNAYGRPFAAKPIYRTYIKSLADAPKAFDRAEKAGIRLAARANLLVTYHRNMLQDKRVARRHQKLLVAKFGKTWKHNSAAVAYGLLLLHKLLKRRGWTEQIDGYAAPGGGVFDDLHTYKWLKG